MQQCTRTNKSSTPWLDDNIRGSRRKRRQLERKNIKTRNDTDRTAYIEQVRNTSKLIQSAKEGYYQEQLELSNNKNVFATLNKLLNNGIKHLPNFDNLNDMRNSFAKYFDSKVSKIRNDLDEMSCPETSDNPVEYCQSVCNMNVSFSSFAHVSVEEVRNTIMSMAPKSCELDSIPL